jgi:hypothetical protein
MKHLMRLGLHLIALQEFAFARLEQKNLCIDHFCQWVQ